MECSNATEIQYCPKAMYDFITSLNLVTSSIPLKTGLREKESVSKSSSHVRINHNRVNFPLKWKNEWMKLFT